MTRVKQLAWAVVLLASAVVASGQEFVLLNPTAGLWNAHSYRVSSDGTVVAGQGNTGWWWTQATGSQLVPPLPGYQTVSVYGMSADGGVLGGVAYPLSGPAESRAYITTRGGIPQELPMPAGFLASAALGLSDDGRIACGILRDSNKAGLFNVAVVWREGVPVILGVPKGWTYSSAWDATDAGVVVGGFWDRVGGGQAAFRWTEPGGMVMLDGAPGRSNCQATRISGDGRVITGSCKDSGPFFHATRWFPGESGQDLGTLPGYPQSDASGHSPDGRLVVGTCYHESLVSRAFLYSDSIGMVDLRSFLISRGISVPVHLMQCADITPDSLTLVGTAGGGTTVAWLARVPLLDCAADCDLNGLLNVSDFICFLNLFARRSHDADCNEDGVLAASDFLCFVDRHAAGCQ